MELMEKCPGRKIRKQLEQIILYFEKAACNFTGVKTPASFAQRVQHHYITYISERDKF